MSSKKHFCCDGDSSTSPKLTGKGSHASSLSKSKFFELNLGLGPNLGFSSCSTQLVISNSLASFSVLVASTENISACTSGVGTGRNKTWTSLPSWDMVE